MSYDIDHQVVTIGFNLFSSSEQHFGISYQVTLIEKKKTVLPQRNVLIKQAPHLVHCLHKFIWTKESWITSSPNSATFPTSNHLPCHL